MVIYHPGLGGTFDDNAVAYEYLASHGYVVLSSAYQSADSSSLNIDGDLATSLDDLQFLLRYAATLPFADVSKVAAMGHSYGAQAVLGWRARPNSAAGRRRLPGFHRGVPPARRRRRLQGGAGAESQFHRPRR